MLENDQIVFAIDTFLTGEHHSPFEKTQREKYCRYFSTFNPSDEALRVQDIVTAIAYLQSRDDVSDINLIGIGEAGLWCLLANAFADGINKTVVDVDGFNNLDESDWVKRLNIPGILRVGGFDTAVACSAPRPLLINDTNDNFDTGKMQEIYNISGYPKNLKVETEKSSAMGILSWLME